MDRKERLAYLIAEAMRRKRLTPPKVARLIGRHADTVRRWRDGENVPSALDIAPLAEVLNVDPMQFIDPPEIPPYPLAEYLVRNEVAEALEEGIDRARRRPGREDA